MIARDIMTENPICVRSDSTAGKAAELLQTLQVRHLPVTQGTELVGILSDRDLRSCYIPNIIDLETLN